MWRAGTEVSRIKYNIVFKYGGLGDQIARMPAVQAILTNHLHVLVDLWVPDYFVELANHFIKSDRLTVKPFSRFKEEVDETIPARITEEMFHSTLRTHLTDHAFHTLLDRVPEGHERAYPRLRPEEIDVSQFALPEKYVVLSTGFTSPVREMLPEVIEGIASWCTAKGYPVVYLGKTETQTGILEGAVKIRGTFTTERTDGIDLVDQTTLLESAKILAQAKAAIGLDNGIVHLAGCTDVPIVVGYTTLKPEHRMPFRFDEHLTTAHKDVYPAVPPPSLACRFCQSNLGFVGSHDFKGCIYQDKLCTKELKAEIYIKELEKILG